MNYIIDAKKLDSFTPFLINYTEILNDISNQPVKNVIFNLINEDKYYHFELDKPNFFNPYVEVNGLCSFENYIKKNHINVHLIHTTNEEINYQRDGLFPKEIKLHKWPLTDIHILYNQVKHQERYRELVTPNIVPNCINTRMLYTCLNGCEKQHRTDLYNRLKFYDLLKIGYVSLNTNVYYNHEKPENIVELPSESTQQHNRPDMGNSFFGNKNFLTDESLSTPIEIVTETHIDVNTFTEKIFKPLLIGKPFLVLGSIHINKSLQDYGFLLFDEIFDYSFDSFQTPTDRIDGIVDNLMSIKDTKWNQITDKVSDKILHNKKRCFEILSNDESYPDLPLTKEELLSYY